MGAEISQAIKSDLEGSTLEELLSNEKFVQTIREAVPGLDENVCKTLRKILTKKSTKVRSKGTERPDPTTKENSSSQDAVLGTSAQDDDLQEAAASPNSATSGVTTALSTTLSGVDTALSLTSDVASSTVSALLGERAPLTAVLGAYDRTQPLWEVKEDEVALPSEIADSFERWKSDPSIFLRSDSSQAPTSLTEQYSYTLSVRTSAVSNKILWRFITTAYYDNISARSQSDRYSITKEAVAFAVAIICKSSSYEREVVEANLINWARDGARNRALADKLRSTGCYFYYPQHLSDWIWVKYLPLSAYDKAAKLLNEFGILEKAQQSGAVDLARSIETTLNAPFQSIVQTQSYGEWILPIFPQQTTDGAGGVEPREHTLELQKRKSEAEALLRKRQKSGMGVPQSPFLPPTQLRQVPVIRDEQASDSHSSAPDSFASTPSTVRSQSFDSSTSPTQSRQPALNHIDYVAIEQPVANTQDQNPLGTIQPETNQTDLSMGQGDQQLVPCSPNHATVDKSALASHGGFTGKVITQLFLPVSDPRSQLQLSVRRKVADTAKSIWFAMKGDIDGLKRLFSEGLASPEEVSNSRGLSLLGWALYAGMWNYHTAQFLVMECNAPIDDWSYDHVWEFACRSYCDTTELKGLECIMANPTIYRDWIGEQNFPEIHQIVLGRSSNLLVTELDDNPFAAYVTDAKGRTALAWATARAQLDDMELLIARGSLVDAMDTSGRSILLNAVDSSNTEGLRILLEAGANPNPIVPEGLCRSSPLIAASFGSKLEMIKLLIEFGAEIDATNPEGWTALQAVIKAQSVECANILLNCGAALGYISKNGQSALTTAIIYNSHAVLKLLMDRSPADHQTGLQLLPIIACSADAETMSILGASALKQTLITGCDFAVSYGILQSRTDYDERLGDAFKEFLSIAEPKRR